MPAGEPFLPVVLFEDEWVVVVDKPSGVPSVPARTADDPPSVTERMRRTFGHLDAVHRLDRDTSGLLMLARSRESRTRLGVSFEYGRVKKRYLAVVCGHLSEGHGEIHLPLAADRDRPPRHRVDPVLGRRAATRWTVLAEGYDLAGQPLTCVDLEPLQGRSHQLRVHLSWLGVPIVGDRLYGPSRIRSSTRLALHAARLDLPHPRDLTTTASLCVIAPPPPLIPDPPDWLTTTLTSWLDDQVGSSAEARTRDQ